MQFAQAFLMGKQFSTDFLATVGPIFMQLFLLSACLILVIFDLVLPKNASFF